MTRNTSVTRIDPNRLADSAVERTACMIDSERALAINRAGWDRVAPIFHGSTALPEYGLLAPTEDTLRLLELTPDLRALELGYGSGHSLRYLAERAVRHLAPSLFSPFPRRRCCRSFTASREGQRPVASPVDTLSQLRWYVEGPTYSRHSSAVRFRRSRAHACVVRSSGCHRHVRPV